MQVLNMRHTMLHRQAILLRASTEKITQRDSELLEVIVFVEAACALQACHDRLPQPQIICAYRSMGCVTVHWGALCAATESHSGLRNGWR